MKKIVLLFSVLLFSVFSMGQNTDIKHMSNINQISFPDFGVPPGPAGVIIGNISVCRLVSMAEVYSTTAIAGATGYVWGVPPGATITGYAPDFLSITVAYPAGSSTGFVSVYGTNEYGAGAPSFLNVTVLGPTLTGPTSVCKGSTGNTYTTEALKTAYVWVVSFGGSITAGGNGFNFVTVTWTSAGSRSVKVTYTDGTCTTFVILPVAVYPVQPGIFGPSSLCADVSGTFNTESGMLNYIWIVSPSGTITAGAGTNTVIANWSVAGPQTISCVYTNPAGCTALIPTVFTVTIKTLPTPTIMANTGLTPCVSPGNVYTTEAGMTGYTWTVSAGGTPTAGGNGFNFVTVTWNSPGPQAVTVNYIGTNGCTAVSPTVYNLTVNPLPVPTITGPESICGVPSAGNIYTTESGMGSYVWTVPTGGTITTGLTTNAITVTWTVLGAQTVTVNYTNPLTTCTAATPTIKNVAVNPLPVPTISGPSAVCINSAGNLYTTEAGQSNYVWSVSPGGTPTLGGLSNDDFVIVTWNGAGPQSVSVNYMNGFNCIALTPTIFPVTVTPNVGIPVFVLGPTSTRCQGAGTVTYTATATDNTGITYSLDGGSLAGGNTIVAATGAVTYVAGWFGTSTITATATGCGLSTQASHIVTITPTVGTPTAITIASGTEPTCQLTNGTTITIYATTATNSTGFNWSLSNGSAGSIGPTTGVMTWANGFFGTVNIQVTANGCNGPSAQVIRTVTITQSVGTPTAITIASGTEPTCQLTNGTTTTTYSTTATNSTGFNWSISNPLAGSIGSTTGVMTWANGFAGTVNIQVTANGCNGPSAQVIRTVAINPTVGTPTAITISAGTEPACQLTNGTTTTTYATTATNSTGFNWSLSNGAAGSIGASTGIMTWANGFFGTVNIQVTANGCNGPSVQVIRTVTVFPRPTPTLTGPSPVCLGSSGNVYITEGGMFSYSWSITGGTINGGQGTNTVTVTWTALGTQSISVNYANANGCTAIAPTVKNVIVNPSPPIPTITGYTSMCVNIGPLDYVTETGMTGYIWTVSPGNAIYSGQGTNHVQINWTVPGTQWVAVIYTSPTGCSPVVPTQLNVFVEPLPGPAGTITGTAAVCGGTNGVAYSVGMIANTSTYVWTLPAGATIATGTGTNSITVDFGPFASSGNITVYGNNVCGNGASSPPFAVTVTPLPDTAGVITGQSAVCQGVSGVIYTVPTIANATSYVWTVPAGAAIVAGGTTNSITVDFSLIAVSGMITVYGTNSCGNGAIGPEFAVTVNPIPPTPIITQINDTTLHSNIPNGNLWYFEGSPAPPPNTGQDYITTQSGHYWCVVTWNDCSSDTSYHIEIVMIGIQTMPPTAVFNVYPVPNDGRFTATIKYPTNGTFTIKVYNNLGVKISEIRNIEVNGTTERSIDLRPTPTGIYSVIFENGNKQVIRKILINR